jgi:hypothetical protein
MSEGTNTFNAQEEIERLKRMFEDGEKAMELAQERMAGLAQVVFQMDEFMRSMLVAGHFDASIAKLQGNEPEQKPKIIM